MEWLLFAYLTGSILGGTLYKKWSRRDLASSGSGNVGARNALRTGGMPAFLFVYGVDLLKVLLVLHVVPAEWFWPAALCLTLGHLYPAFHIRHGGKGYAVFSGVVLAVSPLYYIAGLTLLGLSYLVLRDSVRAGMVPVLCLPFLATGSCLDIAAALGISGLVLYAHFKKKGATA